ncbi:hypothetical protein QYF50_06395 [Paenibacillus vini]|uniref:hypothetical protein n=1 Tax=Paenibacillus vini TaxID=1476024 RepID=UPI0025B73250|nr:hypothetical protein [Paenibacillus vini]MDN4067520.1 hypothetical protein [Paenibacillus vini]
MLRRYKSIAVVCLSLILLLGCSPNSNKNIETSRIIEVASTSKIPNSLVDQDSAKQPHFFIDFKINKAVAKESEESIYPYYKLTSKFKNKLSGSLYIENTQLDTDIVLLVMQGREITYLSQSQVGEEEWSKSLIVKSKKDSIINAEIDIKWDPNKSDELIIFPLVESFGNFYSGAHSSVIRLFIGDNREYTFSNKEIEEKKVQKGPEMKLIPELAWLYEDNQRVETIIKNDKFLTENKYNKLLMTSLNNDTEIDILYVNTLGESDILFKGYNPKKNNDTIFTIDKTKMEEYYNKNARQFLLVLNNKDDDMLKDIIAVNKRINSVSTSFQRIIEIIPHENH